MENWYSPSPESNATATSKPELGYPMYNNVTTRLYYFVLIPIGFLSNLFVLIVAVCIVRHQKTKRSVPDIFLAAIATCDLLSVVAIHLPSVVCFWEAGWVLGDAGCKSQVLLQSFYFNMLFLLQAVVSVDRYNALVRPLWHHSHDSVRRIRMVLGTALVIGVIVSSLNLGCSWEGAKPLPTWYVCAHKVSVRTPLCLASTSITGVIYVAAFVFFIACNVLLFRILMQYYDRSSTNVLCEISKAMTVLDHERKTNIGEGRASVHLTPTLKRFSFNIDRLITPNALPPDPNRSAESVVDMRKASTATHCLLPAITFSKRPSFNPPPEYAQKEPLPEADSNETTKLLESNSSKVSQAGNTSTISGDTDISNPENFQNIPFIDVEVPEIQVLPDPDEQSPAEINVTSNSPVIPDIKVIPEVTICAPTEESDSAEVRSNLPRKESTGSIANRPKSLNLLDAGAAKIPVINLPSCSPSPCRYSPTHGPDIPVRLSNGNILKPDFSMSNNLLTVPGAAKRPSAVTIQERSRAVSVVSRQSVVPNTWEFFYFHRQLMKLLKKLSKKADEERREVRMARLMLMSAALFVLLWIPYSVILVLWLTGTGVHPVAEDVALKLVFLNALLNPIVCLTSRQNYRKGFLYLIRACVCIVTCGFVDPPGEKLVFFETQRKRRIKHAEQQIHRIRSHMGAKERRKSAFNVLQQTLQHGGGATTPSQRPPSPQTIGPAPPTTGGFLPSRRLQELFEKYCMESDSESSGTSSEIDYDFLAFDINLQAEGDDHILLDIDYDALMASDFNLERRGTYMDASFFSHDGKSNATQSWPTETSKRFEPSKNSTV